MAQSGIKLRKMNFGIGFKLCFIEIILVILGLMFTVMIPVAQAGATVQTAHAAPFWDTKGTLLLQGKVTVSDLLPAKIIEPPISIPLHRIASSSLLHAPVSLVPLATTSISQNIVVGTTINGLGYDGVTPPDVQVAAGPINIMEMDNVQGGIWTKAGAPVGTNPFNLGSFFLTGSDFISDPKVFFDAISGRWFASILDVTSSSIKVAISNSSDAANSSYCIYKIPGSSSLPDQPIIGISDDKFVVSVNNFNTFGLFMNAQVYVANKSQMLTCSRTVNFVSGKSSSFFSIHPVESLTSTTTQYMVSTSQPSTINLFSITGVPPNTVTSSIKGLSVSSIQIPPSALQNGTSFTLDTGDTRVQDAVWANNILWLAHNNQCTPSGDTTPRSCLHLVQINTSNTTVNQDFDYGVPGKYVFYPALRIIPSSMNLLLVLGFSSMTDFPGINVTEQLVSDAPNTLEAPVLLQKGLGPVTLSYGCSGNVCRYGDYFGAGLDPSISNGVWVAGEYGSGIGTGNNAQWATQIGNITG